MALKKNVLLLSIFIVCLSSFGQVSPLHYRNFMGLGYGKGVTRCISTLSNGNTEEYYCKTNDYLYTFNINTLSHSDKSGFKFGIYLDGTIGFSVSDWYIRNGPNPDITWQNDFGVLMNCNLGLQAGYYFKDANMVLGLRYFNNYNADQIRSGYGNADDPASIGLFFTKNSLDADFSYGSDKIPGLLVRSPVADILRFNCRYNIPRKNFEDGDALMCVGLRYEYNRFLENDSFINLSGIDKAKGYSIWFVIGVRL